MGSRLKYQNLPAFENHLKEAYPNHLSHAYMVICPDLAERRQIVEKIAQLTIQVIGQNKGERHTFRLGEEKHTFDEFFELLHSQSLFGSHRVMHLEGVELLKKAEAERLATYLAKPSSFVYLILSASQFTATTNFYAQAKKELILLDMSAEKPWDKKKRVKEWLCQEAVREKKTLTDEAALFLVENVGTERAMLDQELFKLITYVGDRKAIVLSDALAMISNQQSANMWKLAEQLIWEEEPLPRQPLEDLSALLGLIAQLRSQLDIGLRLSSLLAKDFPMQELASHFPTLRPPVLQRNCTIARKRGLNFFAKALILLFDVELDAKNQPVSPDLLWDLLISKITFMKLHATALSKSPR